MISQAIEDERDSRFLTDQPQAIAL